MQQESFVEIGRHVELYNNALDLISALGERHRLGYLVCEMPSNQTRKSVLATMATTAEMARCYLDDLKRVQEAVKKENVEARLARKLCDVNADLKRVQKAVKPSDSKPRRRKSDEAEADHQGNAEAQLARKICDVYAQLSAWSVENSINDGATSSTNGSSCHIGPVDGDWIKRVTGAAGGDTDGRQRLQLEKDYVETMKPLQFKVMPFVVAAEGVPQPPAVGLASGAIKTIVKEWSALRSALPLELASSVFVRVDEARLDLMQALIIGPEGTPYADGCFLFDITFGDNYPLSPPVLKLKTTGNGSVRFNPNLYNCGKVCLSLLGTWSGDQSEQWHPSTSSVLQVLISVQSLIFIADPYFNEPGYEGFAGTTTHQEASRRYNLNVMSNCIKWAMYEQLRSPPAGFADVIRAHYKLKKDVVKKQLDDWSQVPDVTEQTTVTAKNLTELLDDL